MPKAKLNNISLYYEIYGKGYPLLLIGGLGSDCSSWLGIVKGLSLHFKTIVFDNRGCGRSGIGNDKITVAKMAKDAIELLDFLKIEKAHILGHSMGGYIAQELAINYSNRVNKLILESTAPVSSERNNALFNDIYAQLKKEGHSKVWFKRWVELLFSPGLIKGNSFVDAFIDNSLKYPYLQTADGLVKNQLDIVIMVRRVFVLLFLPGLLIVKWM
ncbi:MAG: alpha/beta hydrolase, partial [Candidatus Omnitrophica bacterium]|nr:alpha/beta hydrolase [Candidatus Omnitrophota bacterium]